MSFDPVGSIEGILIDEGHNSKDLRRPWALICPDSAMVRMDRKSSDASSEEKYHC